MPLPFDHERRLKMLQNPLRAFDLPTFRPYTTPVPQPMQDDPSDTPLHLKVNNGRFVYAATHRNVTNLVLASFTASQPHTDLFTILGNMSWLESLYLEPAAGMFPELDLLDPAVLPTLTPPRIIQRRRRTNLSRLRFLVVIAKPSFCSALMNQCVVPFACSVDITCMVSAERPTSDPIDDLLPRFRERIRAAALIRAGEELEANDDLPATEMTLELHHDRISMANDSRGTPFVCDTVTKLTIQYARKDEHSHNVAPGFEHGYFLPPLLQVFRQPSQPTTLNLHGDAEIPGEKYHHELLSWLMDIGDEVHQVTFFGDLAFRYFAPLLAVRIQGSFVCGTMVELHLKECDVGKRTISHRMLQDLIRLREVENLIFNRCPGLDKKDFRRSGLYLLVDEEDDDEEYEDDDEMTVEDPESDGYDSDVTVQGSRDAVNDDDDAMDCDDDL